MQRALRACRRGIEWAALAMFLAETASIAVETAVLVGNSGMTVAQAMNGGPLVPQVCAALCALLLLLLARFSDGTLRTWTQLTMLAGALVLVAAAVALSHAVSRMDHRVLLTAFTALHHLGTAAWIGAMPFLLITLKRTDDVTAARRIVGRFSRMAMVSVALLLGAGIGLAWFYVASPSGLYGTTYGVLVMVKACLLLLILLLGASNWYVQREIERAPVRLLMRIRRFAEVEIALGFTAILAAAALTSQPPAVDMPTDRVTLPEIQARMRWETPRMKSPPYTALVPATPIDVAVKTAQYQPPAASDANDMAWSEYNHHWAGLVVLAAGALALLSRFRRMRWARFWPASFAGLAVFILLRADPENWPLGPRPFWGSFFEPDCVAASRGGGADSGLCGIRMRGAGRKTASSMGAICVSADVRGRRGAAADPRSLAGRRQGRGAGADESCGAGAVRRGRRMVAMAGAAAAEGRRRRAAACRVCVARGADGGWNDAAGLSGDVD